MLNLKCETSVKLVYLSDKYDFFNNDNDILKVELNKNDIDIFEFTIDNVDEEYLLKELRNKYPDDIEFYNKFYNKIQSFKPNETEREIINENINVIYNNYKKESHINFGILENIKDSETVTITKMKSNRIIDVFFKKKNNWERLEKDFKYQLVFFELIMYHYYFFNKAIHKDLVTQFLVIYCYNNSSSNDRATIKELRDDLINKTYNHTKKHINEISTFDESMNSNLQSVDEDTIKSMFELAKSDIWIIHFIINNKSYFLDKLHFEYLNNNIDFVKFFLFFSNHKDYNNISFYNKSLDFLNENDKFIFKLLVANRLMSIPSQEDKIGNFYIQGSIIAQEAWLSYGTELNVKQLLVRFFNKFRFNFKEIEVKPYKTLYYILYDKINRAGFIKLEMNEIIRIIDKVNINKFANIYTSHLNLFNSNSNELIKRYNYYISHNIDITVSNYYLQLIHDIENIAIVLLPRLKEKFIDELPKINMTKYKEDISKFKKLRSKDLDYIFLLILTSIHNISYFSVEQKQVVPLNKNINSESTDFINELLYMFRERLLELGRKKLNYKKNNYYELYKIKYHLLLDLLNILQFKFTEDFSLELVDAQFIKLEGLINQFKNIEDYYGIVDTYFWFSWFEIRLNKSLISNINDYIAEILKYNKKLGYFHFNNSLMYMGIISNSTITPRRAYYLITNFLNRKSAIPKFIKSEFLIILQLICYNGQFANKQQLLDESLSITEDLLKNYKKYLSNREATGFEFTKLSLLSNNIEENKDEIEKLLITLEPRVYNLPDIDKGIFYLRYIEYLYESNQIDKIISNNYIILTKKYLQKNKFYYIQFLRENLTIYNELLIADSIKRLNKRLDIKISNFNELVNTYNEKISKGNSQSYIYKDDKIKIENLKTEIDNVNKQLSTIKNQQPLLDELEQEFDRFINYNNFKMSLLNSENYPSRYLIATTARLLAKRNHAIFTISHKKTLNYYKIAMENFYNLKEYIPFLKMALELKVFSKKLSSYSINTNSFEDKVKSLISLYNTKDKILFDKLTNNETEELSNLIYDYQNTNLSKMRENYSYLVDVNNKIEKNEPGMQWKFDNDTQGLRKLLSIYFWNVIMQKDFNDLVKQFDKVLVFALEHIEQLTFDDIQTIKGKALAKILEYDNNSHKKGISEHDKINIINKLKAKIKRIEMEYRKLVELKMNKNATQQKI